MEKVKLNLKNDYLMGYGISNGRSEPKRLGYDNIYYQTNENLVDAYKKIDFKGKKVLSVMASGDQVFTAKMLGAKTVDTFDANKLTYYYYYLRKWSIMYENKLMPDIYSKKWMYNLLKKVVPQNEEESIIKKFWILQYDRNPNFKYLFMNEDYQMDGKRLYNDSKDLLPYISSDVKFYHMNLFNINDLEGDYDIIIISNILDWARNDYNCLKNACTNFSKLLKKDGIILCSSLSRDNRGNEQNIFSFYSFNDMENGENYIYKKR